MAAAKKTTSAPRRPRKSTSPAPSPTAGAGDQSSSPNASAPASSHPRLGKVVALKNEDDRAPQRFALVVSHVSETEHRAAGAYVVHLPDPVHVELDQIESV